MVELCDLEIINEVYKDQEIRSNTDISMSDCDNFWDKMFENEMHDDQEKFYEGDKSPFIDYKIESMNEFWDEVFSNEIADEEVDNGQEGLTTEEKEKIKEEMGWSDEIIDNIENMDQYERLKNAGLVEKEINGRECLIKQNIDLDYEDEDGVTNRQRMERGLAPLDAKTGKPLELHHLGQKADSPLVELTEEEHRTGEYKDGKKNQSLWHDNSKETEVHGQGNNWDSERKDHWETRVNDLKGDK